MTAVIVSLKQTVPKAVTVGSGKAQDGGEVQTEQTGATSTRRLNP